MGYPDIEGRQAREASLRAEAQELVDDRALRCELCRRRMRYFPVRGDVVVRCYGRGYDWRCMDCAAGAVVIAAQLSGRGILPGEWFAHWHDLATAILAQYRDMSRAHARRRSALFAEALERLCMQLQVAGQLMAGYGDAVALGNVLPFRLRGGLSLSALLGRADSPSAEAPN